MRTTARSFTRIPPGPQPVSAALTSSGEGEILETVSTRSEFHRLLSCLAARSEKASAASRAVKSSIHAHRFPRRDFRQKLARLLQTSIVGLSALAADARRLRERASRTRSYGSLCTHIDSLVTELHTAVRTLAARAAALGSPIPSVETDRTGAAAGQKRRGEWLTTPADLASVLAADCQTCGTRVCQLMQAAQAAHDQHSAQIAYALLRNLEKQLWLLRPHTMGSAHPFPFTTLSV